MGGKKKTKWRKVPLAEFTNDPSSSKEIPSEDISKPDIHSNEAHENPDEDVPENYAQYTLDSAEYPDGVWYPTTYLLYNPAEAPAMYPNYVMPFDNSYGYYYTLPEVPHVQEYAPVTYPEYPNALKTDTVYLLFPAESFRASQGVPPQNSDWYNRRRRRRYESYADYAVIPQKAQTANLNKDETDLGKRAAQNVTSRSSHQPYNLKMMSSCDSSTVSSENTESNRGVKPNDKKSELLSYSPGEVNDLDKSHLKKSKKMIEVIGIHSKKDAVKKDNQHNESHMPPINLKPKGDLGSRDVESSITNIHNEEHRKAEDIQDIAFDIENNTPNTRSKVNSTTCQEPSKNQDSINHNIGKVENEIQIQPSLLKLSHNGSLNGKCEKNKGSNSIISENKLNELPNIVMSENEQILSEDAEKMTSIKSQMPLPDILNTVSKSVPLNPRVSEKEVISTRDNLRKIHVSEKDSETEVKSKSLTSQIRVIPNLYSSDILRNETETDLKRISYLHSLPTNQSIYKLAFDESIESITDQSEADSRSPSPVDADSQVPKSLTNAEILIHEAESGSDAGSEDVELIPHRYESETFLNENKNIYVNKLSLAVELLRTQENLPYDDEFKRVVGDNSITALKNVQPSASGKTNFGFVDDSSSMENSIALDTFNNQHGMTSVTEITTEPIFSKQSAIISHSSAEDSCEVAKEAIAQTSDNQGSTEEIRAGYRRFGVQARHYLSPRATIVNPCFCCIVM
ncbi:uncharacterized protein LOC129231353 [Uloborus diversus]|uniref:uncharacterized protein LOC129231353 n=1 Tax=Uloborus diversus TaxID=327109 RepID=UPI00240A94FD|nr:uncharacterized protein LOC129231353 [Uloborus diversus]